MFTEEIIAEFIYMILMARFPLPWRWFIYIYICQI